MKKKEKKNKRKYCFTCDNYFTELSLGGDFICPRCDIGRKPDGTEYNTKELTKIGTRWKEFEKIVKEIRERKEAEHKCILREMVEVLTALDTDILIRKWIKQSKFDSVQDIVQEVLMRIEDYLTKKYNLKQEKGSK